MAFSNAVRTLSSFTLPLESSRTLVASATVLSVFEALTAFALPLTSFTVFSYAVAVLSSRAVTALMSFNPSAGHSGISVFVFSTAFTVEANVPTVFASLTSESLTLIAVFTASDSRYSVSFFRAFTALSYEVAHSSEAAVNRSWFQYRYPPVPTAAKTTTAVLPAINGTSHFGRLRSGGRGTSNSVTGSTGGVTFMFIGPSFSFICIFLILCR